MANHAHRSDTDAQIIQQSGGAKAVFFLNGVRRPNRSAAVPVSTGAHPVAACSQ